MILVSDYHRFILFMYTSQLVIYIFIYLFIYLLIYLINNITFDAILISVFHIYLIFDYSIPSYTTTVLIIEINQ